MADLGRARYSQVQPGTVLKRPIMFYISKKQALNGYKIILRAHKKWMQVDAGGRSCILMDSSGCRWTLVDTGRSGWTQV